MKRTNNKSDTGDFITLDNEKQVIDVLGQSVQGLWEVVNNLTRLRPKKREEFRVTIFGSARIPRKHWVYVAVRDLSAELGCMGCSIVTGGGPGLMEAANEGIASLGPKARGRNIGINVHLPFEQSVNPFVKQSYEHRTFFSRLHHFVLVSDAYVVVPGGIGTVLELTMIWQLLQVQKLGQTPLILIGKMWPDLIKWAEKHLLRSDLNLVNPADLKIPKCVETADQAVEIIRHRYEKWRKKSIEPSR
ncbi:MAG: hypothetical protein KCHDKBKB_02245 [Elusimicrobia bacterium]|nr:hypothetical protein [Elusimicrobiota bacterium]